MLIIFLFEAMDYELVITYFHKVNRYVVGIDIDSQSLETASLNASDLEVSSFHMHDFSFHYSLHLYYFVGLTP